MSQRRKNASGSIQRTPAKMRLSSSVDRMILESLGPVVEGLGRYFGKHFEVVLHTTDDFSHSVLKIENGHVTGRTVGAPMTDYGIEILRRAANGEDSILDTYYAKTSDGRTLRSFSVVIRNNLGSPIGLLCFNMDVSAPLVDFLESMSMAETPTHESLNETFPSSVDDLVQRCLGKAIAGLRNEPQMSSTKRNRCIVNELYGMGVFDVKGAAHRVAQEMGVSVYTIYNYMREARFLNEHQ
jgi:predicted transcriptional regulator YheO